MSNTLLHFLSIIICQHNLLFYCNGNTWVCEVAVYLYRWRYRSTIIYSSVQQFHMTSKYFTFQILATSARNKVYVALFNTEDHTQKAWKYLLFYSSQCFDYVVHTQSEYEVQGVKRIWASFCGVCRANGHSSLLPSSNRARTCFLSEAPHSLQI